MAFDLLRDSQSAVPSAHPLLSNWWTCSASFARHNPPSVAGALTAGHSGLPKPLPGRFWKAFGVRSVGDDVGQSPAQLTWQAPLCDIPSGCCFFTGPWTVTRSSLRMLRRVATFCRPLRPVLLLVLFARQRRPVVGVLRMCWLLPGSFDCVCCPHTSVHRPSVACLAVFPCA